MEMEKFNFSIWKFHFQISNFFKIQISQGHSNLGIKIVRFELVFSPGTRARSATKFSITAALEYYHGAKFSTKFS